MESVLQMRFLEACAGAVSDVLDCPSDDERTALRFGSSPSLFHRPGASRDHVPFSKHPTTSRSSVCLIPPYKQPHVSVLVILATCAFIFKTLVRAAE
ncbi:hypothetical protein BU26DRAFT_270924 [Trematosphaeria pertusa]|uniref:Uncharacterized protein n=1 Tax=Trematosphaeria pertusa TaxID=390896 RepID=A0A6A6IJT8_9PLEO|nr:uncharacterized protein BU26DRAFT_270924 [Trematosphaeria pertusa]KAF2250844.1 hypothetical protein BU26DRAFT_270924 [Trematosphaeria pertusa]